MSIICGRKLSSTPLLGLLSNLTLLHSHSHLLVKNVMSEIPLAVCSPQLKRLHFSLSRLIFVIILSRTLA
uniref:Uncharacterized protein n=1 Tax=Panstrongylus lignarius TaxID=156445 RepID=A0A224Y6Q8_9HEMI